MTMTNEALRSNRQTASGTGWPTSSARRAPLERSCARRSAAHHDRRVEGRGRRSSQRARAARSTATWRSRHAMPGSTGTSPTCFKWAAMAAIASHHVRLALFPLRLDTDRTGYVDIPHSPAFVSKLLLTEDVNTIRATNNAIFDDIFWVHLAYVTADDGIERLRALLRADDALCAHPRRLRGDRPRSPCP